MMAVTLSLRIGRSGSLVTIITKSVSTPKSCSPGSTDTFAVKELPAGMRCPGTSVVAILPLVSRDYAETGKLYDMRQGRLLDYRLPE